jgi:hypothetical protein
VEAVPEKEPLYIHVFGSEEALRGQIDKCLETRTYKEYWLAESKLRDLKDSEYFWEIW